MKKTILKKGAVTEHCRSADDDDDAGVDIVLKSTNFVPRATIRANGIVVLPQTYSVIIEEAVDDVIQLIKRVEAIILNVVQDTDQESKVTNLFAYLRGIVRTTGSLNLYDYQYRLLMGILEYYEQIIKSRIRLYKTLGLMDRAFECMAEQKTLRALTTTKCAASTSSATETEWSEDDLGIWDPIELY